MKVRNIYKSLMAKRSHTYRSIAKECNVSHGAIQSLPSISNPRTDTLLKYLTPLGYTLAVAPVGSRLPDDAYIVTPSTEPEAPRLRPRWPRPAYRLNAPTLLQRKGKPMTREIKGGDVLQSSTAFARHYVFDLGGTLYVDRTPQDEDGEYLYPTARASLSSPSAPWSSGASWTTTAPAPWLRAASGASVTLSSASPPPRSLPTPSGDATTATTVRPHHPPAQTAHPPHAAKAPARGIRRGFGETGISQERKAEERERYSLPSSWASVKPKSQVTIKATTKPMAMPMQPLIRFAGSPPVKAAKEKRPLVLA